MSTAQILDTMADPTRRKIVAILSKSERPVAYIAKRCGVSSAAASQHLKKMRAAGVVIVRPAAQQRYYALNRVALIDAATWMYRMAGFWNARLDALEAAMKEELEDE